MATLSTDDLNERQKRILELIAVGLKDEQIAIEMQLSLSSVHSEVRLLLSKFGEKKRTGLATAAFCYSLLCPKTIVGMTLDCVNMTAEARKYADEHGYCDGKPTTPSDPSTNGVGTEVGDCGTTVLEVLDGIQPDVARFNQSAYSTRGGIVEVRKELSWVNFWSGRTGSHNQNYLAFGDWFNTDYIDTGTGTVRGTMKGWALLFWGGQCFFAPTAAQEYIY